MRAVDAVIHQRLQSDVVLINTISDYIIAAGGKRLRPALLLMMARALGYHGAYRHEMAAVIEFIHTATLLHDDVVDDSDLRRGRQTANAVFGNPASVLVGDFLYSRAFQMMVEPGQMAIMRVLADATNTIAEGEVLQLLNCHDPNVDEARYLQVIRYKTARLFEAAAQIAALLAGAGEETQAACAAYGRHLGTAFQIIDDVLDYSGDSQETGKNVGDDLREGKLTLPLIWLREQGTDEQQALVRAAIVEGDLTLIEPLTRALQDSGALNYARQCAQREAELAEAALQALPVNSDSVASARQDLVKLCQFAVGRSR
ncbi:MAG: polyprenyl synthetase family protein [Burkholderiales bacterium]|nr:polyprenyl synthetase family protein [Burkholderiales bacterium]MCA3162314.1 polyprenyl synthetase family protein [Burkholderiales bacterium]MCA3163176.1 polyprenyl synthetase family protein [Burkholderiales bacterium]MCA3166399.1 polyprenyl synthetase family protein [Burkholderiales bacterium]MCA3169371.1 polyprenyl synthetase family protein [Burkholderiales bacterium]